MSRKTMIVLGMIVGSVAGGYAPTLLGAGALSFAPFVGSVVGGILGIWIAYVLTQ